MSLMRFSLGELKRSQRHHILGPHEAEDYNTLARSCYCLLPDNRFRVRLILLVDNVWFDRFILLLIAVNSVCLAMGDPSLDDNAGIQDFLQVSDITFLVVFVLEAVVRALARGFVLHHGSYLRNPWNVLDFLVVVLGAVQFVIDRLSSGGPGNNNFLILRALRILRPLRSISRVKSLRVLLSTLFNSVPQLINIILLLFLLVFIFAILGVQLFAGGHHHRCYLPEGTTVNLTSEMTALHNVTGAACALGIKGVGDATSGPYCQCNALATNNDRAAGVLGGVLGAGPWAATAPLTTMWPMCNTLDNVCGEDSECRSVDARAVCAANRDVFHAGYLNFDNVAWGSLLVLKIASLDDWPEDQTDLQQRAGHHVWVFFFLLTVLGNFFVFNLVLAVLSSQFTLADRSPSLGNTPVLTFLSPMNILGGQCLRGPLALCTGLHWEDEEDERQGKFAAMAGRRCSPFYDLRKSGVEMPMWAVKQTDGSPALAALPTRFELPYDRRTLCDLDDHTGHPPAYTDASGRLVNAADILALDYRQLEMSHPRIAAGVRKALQVGRGMHEAFDQVDLRRVWGTPQKRSRLHTTVAQVIDQLPYKTPSDVECKGIAGQPHPELAGGRLPSSVVDHEIRQVVLRLEESERSVGKWSLSTIEGRRRRRVWCAKRLQEYRHNTVLAGKVVPPQMQALAERYVHTLVRARQDAVRHGGKLDLVRQAVQEGGFDELVGEAFDQYDTQCGKTLSRMDAEIFFGDFLSHAHRVMCRETERLTREINRENSAVHGKGAESGIRELLSELRVVSAREGKALAAWQQPLVEELFAECEMYGDDDNVLSRHEVEDLFRSMSMHNALFPGRAARPRRRTRRQLLLDKVKPVDEPGSPRRRLMERTLTSSCIVRVPSSPEGTTGLASTARSFADVLEVRRSSSGFPDDDGVERPEAEDVDPMGTLKTSEAHKKEYPLWRRQLVEVVEHTMFTTEMMFLTMWNVAALAADSYPTSAKVNDFVDTSNMICSIGFIAEACLKLLAYHLKYFCDAYNCFDFVLVLVSIPEFFLADSGVSAFSVLRAFRILRGFRMLKTVPALKKLVGTILSAMGSVGSVCVLVLLYIFIFAVLGMELFGGDGSESRRIRLDPDDTFFPRIAFTTFGESWISTFVLMTGERWGTAMKLYMARTSPAACLYFIANYFIGNCIFLNLFVAILIDELGKQEDQRELEEAEAVIPFDELGPYSRTLLAEHPSEDDPNATVEVPFEAEYIEVKGGSGGVAGLYCLLREDGMELVRVNGCPCWEQDAGPTEVDAPTWFVHSTPGGRWALSRTTRDQCEMAFQDGSPAYVMSQHHGGFRMPDDGPWRGHTLVNRALDGLMGCLGESDVTVTCFADYREISEHSSQDLTRIDSTLNGIDSSGASGRRSGALSKVRRLTTVAMMAEGEGVSLVAPCEADICSAERFFARKNVLAFVEEELGRGRRITRTNADPAVLELLAHEVSTRKCRDLGNLIRKNGAILLVERTPVSDADVEDAEHRLAHTLRRFRVQPSYGSGSLLDYTHPHHDYPELYPSMHVSEPTLYEQTVRVYHSSLDALFGPSWPRGHAKLYAALDRKAGDCELLLQVLREVKRLSTSAPYVTRGGVDELIAETRRIQQAKQLMTRHLQCSVDRRREELERIVRRVPPGDYRDFAAECAQTLLCAAQPEVVWVSTLCGAWARLNGRYEKEPARAVYRQVSCLDDTDASTECRGDWSRFEGMHDPDCPWHWLTDRELSGATQTPSLSESLKLSRSTSVRDLRRTCVEVLSIARHPFNGVIWRSSNEAGDARWVLGEDPLSGIGEEGDGAALPTNWWFSSERLVGGRWLDDGVYRNIPKRGEGCGRRGMNKVTEGPNADVRWENAHGDAPIGPTVTFPQPPWPAVRPAPGRVYPLVTAELPQAESCLSLVAGSLGDSPDRQTRERAFSSVSFAGVVPYGDSDSSSFDEDDDMQTTTSTGSNLERTCVERRLYHLQSGRQLTDGTEQASPRRKKRRKKDRRKQRDAFQVWEFGPGSAGGIEGWCEADLSELYEDTQWPELSFDPVDDEGVPIRAWDKLRYSLSKVVLHPWFDLTVTALIIVSFVVICMDTPRRQDEEKGFSTGIERADIAFAVAFILESVLKIIVFGVGPYAADKWNCTDFIVALVALTALFERRAKPFRSLRTIRIIVRLPELRLLVESLIRVMPQVANIVLLLVAYMFIWAILGVSVFKGQYYECSDSSVTQEGDCSGLYNTTSYDAFGGQVTTAERRWGRPEYDPGFDNVAAGMLTLFIMVIGDGWASPMFRAMDIQGKGLGPERNQSWYASIYFLLFMVFGQFFLLNLFIGILIDNFLKQREMLMKAKGSNYDELTGPAKIWMQTRDLVAHGMMPSRQQWVPKNPLCLFCYRLATGKWPTRIAVTNTSPDGDIHELMAEGEPMSPVASHVHGGRLEWIRGDSCMCWSNTDHRLFRLPLVTQGVPGQDVGCVVRLPRWKDPTEAQDAVQALEQGSGRTEVPAFVTGQRVRLAATGERAEVVHVDPLIISLSEGGGRRTVTEDAIESAPQVPRGTQFQVTVTHPAFVFILTEPLRKPSRPDTGAAVVASALIIWAFVATAELKRALLLLDMDEALKLEVSVCEKWLEGEVEFRGGGRFSVGVAHEFADGRRLPVGARGRIVEQPASFGHAQGFPPDPPEPTQRGGKPWPRCWPVLVRFPDAGDVGLMLDDIEPAGGRAGTDGTPLDEDGVSVWDDSDEDDPITKDPRPVAERTGRLFAHAPPTTPANRSSRPDEDPVSVLQIKAEDATDIAGLWQPVYLWGQPAPAGVIGGHSGSNAEWFQITRQPPGDSYSQGARDGWMYVQEGGKERYRLVPKFIEVTAKRYEADAAEPVCGSFTLLTRDGGDFEESEGMPVWHREALLDGERLLYLMRAQDGRWVVDRTDADGSTSRVLQTPPHATSPVAGSHYRHAKPVAPYPFRTRTGRTVRAHWLYPSQLGDSEDLVVLPDQPVNEDGTVDPSVEVAGGIAADVADRGAPWLPRWVAHPPLSDDAMPVSFTVHRADDDESVPVDGGALITCCHTGHTLSYTMCVSRRAWETKWGEDTLETCKAAVIVAAALAVGTLCELTLTQERRRRDGGFCRTLGLENWFDCTTMWGAPKYGLPYPSFKYAQEAYHDMRMFTRFTKPSWHSLRGVSELTVPATTTDETTFVMVIVPIPATVSRFDMCTTLCIVLNAVTLAMGHYQQSSPMTSFLGWANLVFVIIFALEAAVKILGLGPRAYFADSWNRFDFLVVAVSILGLFSFFQNGGFTVVRLFRIGRLLRLIKRAKKLNVLFSALVESMPQLTYVAILLVVVFSMFAAVGVELFGRIDQNGASGGIDEYTNFKDVYYALISLYAISTTEGWVEVMDGTWDVGAPCQHNGTSAGRSTCGTSRAVSVVFFLSFMVIGSCLIVNMFVTVVVDGYNRAEQKAGHMELLDKVTVFSESWSRADTRAKHFLPARVVFDILQKLDHTLWPVSREAVEAAERAAESGKWLSRAATEFQEKLRLLREMNVPLSEAWAKGHCPEGALEVDRLHVRYIDVSSALIARVLNSGYIPTSGDREEFEELKEDSGSYLSDEQMVQASKFTRHELFSRYEVEGPAVARSQFLTPRTDGSLSSTGNVVRVSRRAKYQLSQWLAMNKVERWWRQYLDRRMQLTRLQKRFAQEAHRNSSARRRMSTWRPQATEPAAEPELSGEVGSG